ncbi:GNAT family N-acetyltransferase [Corallincola luteus]|uniref:GNAT family N-acetyltransferase n=2 Tax=Corallincola luteus TaxID=1775177 RepID=A0ABY2AFY3_9GAMM|nr:GNAT family N-acetyltransferase [Corallincola luteus]
MSAEEFVGYREYSNNFRGSELAAAYGHSQSDAISLANEELDECLPDGLSTEGNHLMCIEHNGAGVIGYLWYVFNSGENSAFIYDFQVIEQFRGKGYGRKIFAKLEQTLRSEGVEQIELLVAYENKQAANLYAELGFKPTGVNMVKCTKTNNTRH